MHDCIIVGAGLTGLTLATELKKNGLSVVLIESASRVGGVISSEHIDNHLIENGPHSFVLKPQLQSMINELGLNERLVYPGSLAKKRYVAINRSDGSRSLMATPSSINEAFKSKLLSNQAKWRLFAEPCAGRLSGEDVSIRDFGNHHFGQTFTSRLIAAMTSGIYAGDIDQLSIRSCFPRLWSLEQNYGSVLLGAILSRNKHRPTLCSFRDGLQELTNKLESRFTQEELFLKHQVDHLSLDKDSVTVGFSDKLSGLGRALRARVCALCTPAAPAASLIKELQPDLASKINAIPYAPLGILQLSATEILHPLDGFGFLASPTKDKALLGTIFSSSLFEKRAPSGRHLLSCFVGGAVNPQFSDVRNEKVERQVIDEVSELLEIGQRPNVVGRKYWPRAIPNFRIGHHHTVKAVDNFHFQFPSIKLLGNWIGGVSVSDRVEAGINTAQEIVSQLKP